MYGLQYDILLRTVQKILDMIFTLRALERTGSSKFGHIFWGFHDDV